MLTRIRRCLGLHLETNRTKLLRIESWLIVPTWRIIKLENNRLTQNYLHAKFELYKAMAHLNFKYSSIHMVNQNITRCRCKQNM